MFLILAMILLALGLVGVFWIVRSSSTRGRTPSERSGLTTVGAVILTVVSFIAGGAALYMALYGSP